MGTLGPNSDLQNHNLSDLHLHKPSRRPWGWELLSRRFLWTLSRHSPLLSSGKEIRDLRTCTHPSPTAQPHTIKPGIPCPDSPRPTVGACTVFFPSLQQGRTMPPLSTPRPHAGWRLGRDTLWGDTAPGAEMKEHQNFSKINKSVMQYVKKGKFIQSPSWSKYQNF